MLRFMILTRALRTIKMNHKLHQASNTDSKQSWIWTDSFTDRFTFVLSRPFSPGLEHPSHLRRMPGDTSPASESWFWFQRRFKLLHESWNTGRNRTRSKMETSFTFFFWFFWSRQSRLCQLVINSEKKRTFVKISSGL